MKVLAFNASPRKDKGNTDILIEQFIEGVQKGGAEVEKYHIYDLDINGCRSCFTCWWKTPGKCVHNDDMDWLFPKIGDADVLIFGTPIYGNNITHYMQRLIERTFPVTLPEMIVRDGEVSHPSRQRKIPKLVIAATCGFPETSPFTVLRVIQPTALFITLPAGQVLQNEDMQEELSDFLDAITKTGVLMARGEPIPAELREKLQVSYSDEMKGKIMREHNLYSKSRMKSL